MALSLELVSDTTLLFDHTVSDDAAIRSGYNVRFSQIHTPHILLIAVSAYSATLVLGKYNQGYSDARSLKFVNSVQRGGRVEIIANDQGHRITPSWVSFNDDERLYVLLSYPYSLATDQCHALCSVGDSAKNAFHSNPKNTVFDAKRLIGRKFDDKDVQRDMKHWPFAVRDRNTKPVISVDYKGEKRDFVCHA